MARKLFNLTIPIYANKYNSVNQTIPVSSGILQGSILSPPLPNIYVSDLPSVSKLLVSFQLHDQHEAIAKMNKDLLSIRN